MTHPLTIDGTRICVLVHPDEVVICTNITGLKALGAWMAWLAASDPNEFYQFHLFWHLESEASRFDSIRPKNVWLLRTPESHVVKSAPPSDMETVTFEITFQVLPESALDELEDAQEGGIIPPKYLKQESSYEGSCE